MKNGVPKFVTLYKYCGGRAVGNTQRITRTVHRSSEARRSRTGVSAFYILNLTCSMQQSPSWEANQFLAGQEILMLRNPHVHDRTYKCPPPDPVLIQLDSVHTPASHLILSSHLHLGLPSGLYPSGFPTKTLCKPILSPIRLDVDSIS